LDLEEEVVVVKDKVLGTFVLEELVVEEVLMLGKYWMRLI
jgi:hypothetical protein